MQCSCQCAEAHQEGELWSRDSCSDGSRNGRKEHAYKYALELIKDSLTYKSAVEKHSWKSEFKLNALLKFAL